MSVLQKKRSSYWINSDWLMTLRPKHLAECQIWKQLREQGTQPSPNSTVSPKDIDWHRAHSLLVRASRMPAGSSYPNLPCLGPHPCALYPWVWELHLRPDLAPLPFYEPCRGACTKLCWVLLFSWAGCSLVLLLVWWCGWMANFFCNVPGPICLSCSGAVGLHFCWCKQDPEDDVLESSQPKQVCVGGRGRN